jgi:hypothetical protein
MQEDPVMPPSISKRDMSGFSVGLDVNGWALGVPVPRPALTVRLHHPPG